MSLPISSVYGVLAGLVAVGLVAAGLWPAFVGYEPDMKLVGMGIAILAPGVAGAKKPQQ